MNIFEYIFSIIAILAANFITYILVYTMTESVFWSVIGCVIMNIVTYYLSMNSDM